MQEYVEILKAELDASKKREKARKVMKYILSCTCPFLNCHLRHDKETGSDLCPAVVSEIVLGDAPVNYWPIFSLSLVKILEAFAKVNLVQFFPGSYVENRPFLHSCKQRHQLEAWVDKIH